MRPWTALRLGRVSNLPTVWTDALAGVVLGGGSAAPVPLALLVVGASLAYVAGMFLNDAFDRAVDARERPERPIPAREVASETVFVWGFAMLGAGVAAITAAGLVAGSGFAAGTAAAALALLIVLYDRHHKANPLGPVVMASCRVAVYVAAALVATRHPAQALAAGSALLTCHLVALTYVAKGELRARANSLWPLVLLAVPLIRGSLPAGARGTALPCVALLVADAIAVALLRRRAAGDVPRAVATLIAGISLVDALAIAESGRPDLVPVALCGFPLTLALQRLVRGT